MTSSDDLGEPLVEDFTSRANLVRIVRAMSPALRTRAIARLARLRSPILALMNLALPDEGSVLDVNCGFGLWSAYFSVTGPRRHIVGIDASAEAIAHATSLATRLDLQRTTFRLSTVHAFRAQNPFDAVMLVDVLHRVPLETQLDVLKRVRDLLSPDGVVLIKDVTTDSTWKLKLTEWLDRTVEGPIDPQAYRHHREWAAILRELGFSVRIVRIPGPLRSPHVLLQARKR